MEDCTCSGNPILFFACAGGSNVGQLANDACRRLAAEGHGKLYCLAGIGGHVSGIVETAKAAKVVAVDGCGVKCAQKSLAAAEVPISCYIVLTDWGIEKKPDLFPGEQEIRQVKEKIMALAE